MSENVNQEKIYTEDELKAMRAEIIKEYKSENALLKLESENAKYKADIAQDRLREQIAYIKLAQLSQQQEPVNEKDEATSQVEEEVVDEK